MTIFNISEDTVDQLMNLPDDDGLAALREEEKKKEKETLSKLFMVRQLTKKLKISQDKPIDSEKKKSDGLDGIIKGLFTPQRGSQANDDNKGEKSKSVGFCDVDNDVIKDDSKKYSGFKPKILKLLTSEDKTSPQPEVSKKEENVFKNILAGSSVSNNNDAVDKSLSITPTLDDHGSLSHGNVYLDNYSEEEDDMGDFWVKRGKIELIIKKIKESNTEL